MAEIVCSAQVRAIHANRPITMEATPGRSGLSEVGNIKQGIALGMILTLPEDSMHEFHKLEEGKV